MLLSPCRGAGDPAAGATRAADPYAADALPGWARAARAVLRNEPNVEIPGPGPQRPISELIRRLPDEAPGKQQYVEFLKETYGYNIDRLNAAYGLEASSFTDLIRSTTGRLTARGTRCAATMRRSGGRSTKCWLPKRQR
jgi:hypothetical protein